MVYWPAPHGQLLLSPAIAAINLAPVPAAAFTELKPADEISTLGTSWRLATTLTISLECDFDFPYPALTRASAEY